MYGRSGTVASPEDKNDGDGAVIRGKSDPNYQPEQTNERNKRV
jgi:hypothetical protein